jgi:formamidopyrimidine-DNA glycosylase
MRCEGFEKQAALRRGPFTLHTRGWNLFSLYSEVKHQIQVFTDPPVENHLGMCKTNPMRIGFGLRLTVYERDGYVCRYCGNC